MKKIKLLAVLMLCPIMLFGQLEKTADGRVGIGTTNPVTALDVRGDVFIPHERSFWIGATRDSGNRLRMHFTNSPVNLGAYIDFWPTLHFRAGSNHTATFCSNRNFGIGTSTPQHRLDVIGNIRTSGRILFSSSNTAVGNNVFGNNTTGSFNTAVGNWALSRNTTGRGNTAIGDGADVSSVNLHNATAIGQGAIATASNQVRLGSTVVASIGGIRAWTNFSDGRAKRSIRTEVPGLEFINLLQPVVYTLNLDIVDELKGIDRTQAFARHSELLEEEGEFEQFEQEQLQLHSELLEQDRIAREAIQNQLQTGFIAQDVRKAAESIGYEFSGVDVDEMGIYGLRYSEFVVPLVRAVQELSQLNDQLQNQVNELNARIERLESANNPIIDRPFGARAATQEYDIFTLQSQEIQDNLRTATLYQNAPNPFSQSTEIRYYLPQNVTTAFLIIYDMNGRQIKQLRISERGEGSLVISGSQLVPGMYLYALIADGKKIDVKRMILTE